MDFHIMKRRQLQELCKKHGIPANKTNVEMANKLTEIFKEKENEHPMFRGKSCLKNVIDVPSDDSKDQARKVKKVRFSPQNEMFEFVDLENEADSRNARAKAREMRQKAMTKPVQKEGGQAIKNNANIEFSVGVMDGGFRRTRSGGRKSMVGDSVVDLVSPPVQKRVRRNVKSKSMHVKDVVELDDSIDVRAARESIGSCGENLAVKGSGVEHGQVQRRSMRNVTNPKDLVVLSGESGHVDFARKMTRSRTQFVEQEASEIEFGRGTASGTESEVQEKCEEVLHLEEPGRGLGRKASTQKSAVTQKAKVRNDGSLLCKENKKKSEKSAGEMGLEIEACKKIPKDVQRNKPLKQLRELPPCDQTPVNIEFPRRSTRNISKHDASVVSNGQDVIVNANRRNGTRKRRRDTVLEEETLLIECDYPTKELPRKSTRFDSKEAIANPTLSGEASGANIPENIATEPVSEVEETQVPLLITTKEFGNDSKKGRRVSSRKSSSKKQNGDKLRHNRLTESRLEVEETPVSMLSHGIEVCNDSKKRGKGSKRKSISEKQSGLLEVCPLISEVEEIGVEGIQDQESVKFLVVNTKQEMQFSMRETVVVPEKETVSIDKEKEYFPPNGTAEGGNDQVCQSQQEGEDVDHFDLDKQEPVEYEANLWNAAATSEATSPVDDLAAVHGADCVGRPSYLLDSGEEWEKIEDSSAAKQTHSIIGSRACHGEEDDNGLVHGEQNSADSTEGNGSPPGVGECNESAGVKKNCENASEEALDMLNSSVQIGTPMMLPERMTNEDQCLFDVAVRQETLSASHASTARTVSVMVTEIEFNAPLDSGEGLEKNEDLSAKNTQSRIDFGDGEATSGSVHKEQCPADSKEGSGPELVLEYYASECKKNGDFEQDCDYGSEESQETPHLSDKTGTPMISSDIVAHEDQCSVEAAGMEETVSVCHASTARTVSEMVTDKEQYLAHSKEGSGPELVLQYYASECKENGDFEQDCDYGSEESQETPHLSDKTGTPMVSPERVAHEDQSSVETAGMQETVSVCHASTARIVSEMVTDIEFNTGGNSPLIATPRTAIIDPELEVGISGYSDVTCSSGHALVINNDAQEQEKIQIKVDTIDQSTMLESRSEESSSFDTQTPDDIMCKDEMFASNSGDGINSQERIEDDATTLAVGTRVPCLSNKVDDAELTLPPTNGQSVINQESGSTEKNLDSLSEEVMKKSMHELSNGEAASFEQFIYLGNEHKQEEDSLCAQFSVQVSATRSIGEEEIPSHEAEKMGKTMSGGEEEISSHEAEKMGKTMSGGEEEISSHEAERMGKTMSGGEALSMTVGSPSFQEALEEDENKWISNIESTSPITSTQITDDGLVGNLGIMDAEGRLYPAFDGSYEDVYAEQEESELLETNHGKASAEGRLETFKLSVGEKAIPLSSQDGVAPVTHFPEYHGYHAGNQNMPSFKHGLSMVDRINEQERDEFEVPASNTKPLEIKASSLYEANCLVTDESTDAGSDKEDDIAEKTKSSSEKKFSHGELEEDALNDRVCGSLCQTASKMLVGGNVVENAYASSLFDEVIGHHFFEDGTADRRENNKVAFDSAGSKSLPDAKLIALNNPEIVSMNVNDNGEELVERNCNEDSVKEATSGNKDVAYEDKAEDEGTEGDCDIERCDDVIKERNAGFCPVPELGDDDDFQKEVAHLNGSVYSNLEETICKGRKESEEETTVEIIQRSSPCITTIDLRKEEENGTSQPPGFLGLGVSVFDYGKEHAKLNINGPGASCDTLLSEASDDASGDNQSDFAVVESIFERKELRDLLMDTESETIQPLDELMSVDLSDLKDEMVQETEPSYFLPSNELSPSYSVVEGRKDQIRTLEGEFGFADGNTVAVEVDASAQFKEKDADDHSVEVKAAEVHQSNPNDHSCRKTKTADDKAIVTTVEEIDMVTDVENEGTLPTPGPRTLSKVVLDSPSERAQMKAGPPDSSDKIELADQKDSHDISDEVVGNLQQLNEANFARFGHHSMVLQVHKSTFKTSDTVNGEVAKGEKSAETFESYFKKRKSGAQKGGNADASLQVTPQEFGECLVDIVADMNYTDHAALTDDIHNTPRVSVDEARETTTDEKGGSEKNKLDLRVSAEVQLLGDASCPNLELGISNVTVPASTVSLTHYVKAPFQADNEVTLDNSKAAERGTDGNNKANFGPNIDDHEGAIEGAFMATPDRSTSNKFIFESKNKTIAEKAGEAQGSANKVNDMAVSASASIDLAVSENSFDVLALKHEIGIDCLAISPVSAFATHENGASQFQVESHVFSSREINLFLEDWEQYEAEEIGDDLQQMTKSTTKLNVGEEKLLEYYHNMEEKVFELNGTDLSSSDEPIFEHAEAVKENAAATTTQEYLDCEDNMKQSVEVEKSFDHVHNVTSTEVVESCGTDCVASDEPITETGLKNPEVEIVASDAAEDGSKHEEVREEIEFSDATPNSKTKMPMQSPAFIDSTIDIDSLSLQPSLDLNQGRKLDAELEESISLSAKQLKSSTMEGTNSRSSLIQNASKKTLWTIDMKENNPTIKTEQAPVVKSMTKRRALEQIKKI